MSTLSKMALRLLAHPTLINNNDDKKFILMKIEGFGIDSEAYGKALYESQNKDDEMNKSQLEEAMIQRKKESCLLLSFAARHSSIIVYVYENSIGEE